MTIPRLSASPALGEVAGRRVTLHYGDVAQEYGALRRGAVLVDRSHRTRLTLSGDKAAEVLTGLVTNDIVSLTPGHGLYAAALTPKGRIIADVRVFCQAGGLLIDVPPRAADGWWAMIRKYVNPRLARYEDCTATLRALGVFGVQARRLVVALVEGSPAAFDALPPYGHVTAETAGAPVVVARVPDLGLDGYELFVPEAEAESLWQRAVSLGATPGGIEAFEIARVEAGRPEWGLDIDETTLAQEANLEALHAISYTKGCYTGQETVARVHFRGHVNRHLRGLLVAGDDAPPENTPLFALDGKLVGDVGSAVRSPRLGTLALALVRREVVPPATVRLSWGSGELTAAVVPLPFPD